MLLYTRASVVMHECESVYVTHSYNNPWNRFAVQRDSCNPMFLITTRLLVCINDIAMSSYLACYRVLMLIMLFKER